MIAHIAQADEHRGRVVLWLGTEAEPQETAVDAAFTLAQAFESEIESVFIEDRQLFDLAGLPFAREIPLSGRGTRRMTVEALERDLIAHAAALQRQVRLRAGASDVKIKTRALRAEPVQALANVCAENGPWNVLTVASASRDANGTGHVGVGLSQLFETVHATTGIVVAGPKAKRTHGPVIAVIEELERAVPMMRAAERIATTTGGDVRLWLLEHDEARQDWIEGQIRLALGDTQGLNFKVIDMSAHTPLSVAGMMRHAGAGFVLTRFGGMLARREQDVAPFAEQLHGPLFLVR